MQQKHKESLDRFRLKIINLISFLLGIAAAFVVYLESDYLKHATGTENITYFYIIAHAVALFLVFNWHHLIRRLGKLRVFFVTISIKCALLFLLAKLPVDYLSAWILAIYMIFAVLTWIDLDILLEFCSVDKATGRIRGVYMTIISAGYLISPLFAGRLVEEYGFQAAFSVAALVVFLIILISGIFLRNIDHRRMRKTKFAELIRKVWGRKNVLRIYYISFLVEFFYALMLIYTPLYLLDLGFNWVEIGKIFTIMLVPFVIFQYPAGILADKYFEERDMLKFALVMMAVPTAMIFFMTSAVWWHWAVILFLTRVGASLVDVLKESYFYKRIDCRDIDIIDFFRTVRPIGYAIGPAIAAPIVYLLHIKFIFPIIGIGVLTGLLATKNLASSRVPPLITKC